jgi:hypothetical protein
VRYSRSPPGSSLEHCASTPDRRAYPGRGHNTAGRHYQSPMYAGLRTSETLHKKFCRIGPWLCIMLAVNFREFFFYEVG